MDDRGRTTSFSNTGPAVDVLGPGSEVYSTMPSPAHMVTNGEARCLSRKALAQLFSYVK